MLCYSPAHALTYKYEIEGLINYSDLYQSWGYDPYIDVVNTTFRLHGTFGDFGTEAYTSFNDKTFFSQTPKNLFYAQSVPEAGFDVLGFDFNIPDPVGSWHIAAFDFSQNLVKDDGSVNWDMFGDLTWQLLWIGVNPDDPNLPEYWEYGGAITSATLTAAPVPEPATIFLCGIGIAGSVGIRIRKKLRFKKR